jgi:hypothetical protein
MSTTSVRNAAAARYNSIINFVPQQEAWVIERMGRFKKILQPVWYTFVASNDCYRDWMCWYHFLIASNTFKVSKRLQLKFHNRAQLQSIMCSCIWTVCCICEYSMHIK